MPSELGMYPYTAKAGSLVFTGNVLAINNHHAMQLAQQAAQQRLSDGGGPKCRAWRITIDQPEEATP